MVRLIAQRSRQAVEAGVVGRQTKSQEIIGPVETSAPDTPSRQRGIRSRLHSGRQRLGHRAGLGDHDQAVGGEQATRQTLPLVRFVSDATSHRLTRWHTTFGQWLILTLVGLHLAAVLFYRLARRRDLIGPMLGGDKLLAAQAPASVDTPATRVVALVLFAAALAAVLWLTGLGG